MGDENNYQSNSGHGACEITRGGKRSDGVEMVREFVGQYSGIDSFSGSCVLAGISAEFRDGEWHLVGKSNNLTANQLAKVMSFQKRFADAIKLGVIVETKRTFNRSVKSTGYRVNGGGQIPDPNLPKTIQRKENNDGSFDIEVNLDARIDADSVKDKPAEPKKTGMPKDFMSEYNLDD